MKLNNMRNWGTLIGSLKKYFLEYFLRANTHFQCKIAAITTN